MWHVQHSPSFPSAGSWLLALILSLIQNVVPSCTCRLYFRLILMSHDNLMVNKPTYLSVLLSPLRPSALHNQFSSLSALPEMHICIFAFGRGGQHAQLLFMGGGERGSESNSRTPTRGRASAAVKLKYLENVFYFPSQSWSLISLSLALSAALHGRSEAPTANAI